MKTKLGAVVLTLIWGLGALGLAFPAPAAAADTYLRVLTINLLFSEIQDRPQRLRIIADFVLNQAEPLDVILLQEVVGGSLFGTDNNAQDLQNLLAAGGQSYYLNTRMEEGIPGIASEGNAVLSRHKIVLSLTKTLPFVEMVDVGGLKIPLRRVVTMNRLDIPNYGQVNIYNTHLCNNCNATGRTKQVSTMLNFINFAEKLLPGSKSVILGGDFNINLLHPKQRASYLAITSKGFIDTYAALNPVGFTCCDPASGGACCTFGVPGNPYAVDFLTHLPVPPQRLDYIFAKGTGVSAANILSSEVVFNSDPLWVSDHSGLLTKFRLP